MARSPNTQGRLTMFGLSAHNNVNIARNIAFGSARSVERASTTMALSCVVHADLLELRIAICDSSCREEHNVTGCANQAPALNQVHTAFKRDAGINFIRQYQALLFSFYFLNFEFQAISGDREALFRLSSAHKMKHFPGKSVI